MQTLLKYQGREVTAGDIEFIKKLIATNPDDSRRRLSKKLCEAWNWVQPNGQLRDMFCRSFMLHLQAEGHIKLPARKCTPHNPLAERKKPARIAIDQRPISHCSVAEIRPLEIRQVRRSAKEELFNSLIEWHHYLGYCHPIGEQLKYIVFAQERPIACFAFSSAPRHIGCRDRFIGWSPEVRQKNLHLMAYNLRFLILPWVQVRFLASHLLGRIVKVVAVDWQRIYNHAIYFLETFVDLEKFTGTSYRAANWIYLGNTTGRGKNAWGHKQTRSIKAVWGYALSKDFRRKLCGGTQ